jgi:hypothetical protein
MATEFQRSRGGPNLTSSFPQKKKANNIWGNLLNEEILTADMVTFTDSYDCRMIKVLNGIFTYV